MRDDEQRLWARICHELSALLDQATKYWLDVRFRDLLDRTRQGGVSVWEWKELLDELAELRDAEEDYAGRNGDPNPALPTPQRPPAARQLSSGFGCPVGLCDRRAAGGLLGSTPRCELLAREMIEIP